MVWRIRKITSESYEKTEKRFLSGKVGLEVIVNIIGRLPKCLNDFVYVNQLWRDNLYSYMNRNELEDNFEKFLQEGNFMGIVGNEVPSLWYSEKFRNA